MRLGIDAWTSHDGATSAIWSTTNRSWSPRSSNTPVSVTRQGLFRTLLDRRVGPPGPVDVAASTEAERRGDQPPTAVQKGVVLRQTPIFAMVSGVEMLHLSVIAEHVRLDTNAPLADETAPSSLAIVLSGELQSRDGGGGDSARRASTGEVVGLYETLAGASTDATREDFVAKTPSSVLRIERDDLFDLLGQRPDLLQQIFAAIFGRSDGFIRQPSEVSSPVPAKGS